MFKISNHANLETNTRLTIDGNGNVGIGTASPYNLTNYTFLSVNHATNGGGMIMMDNGTNIGAIYNAVNTVYLDALADIVIRTGSTPPSGNERMRITAAGHVGIAATPETDWNSSFQAIHLGDNTAFANFTDRGGYWFNNARYNTSSQFTYIDSNEAAVVDLVDGHFRFRSAASGTADAAASITAKFYVSNGGQTVINSSTPKGNAKLSIYGGMYVDPQTWQAAGSGSGTIIFYIEAGEWTIKDLEINLNKETRFSST